MNRPLSRALLHLQFAPCERPGERTSERELAAKLLAGVLAYPRSTLVGVSAGQDAAQVTFTTPTPLPSVAAWYREALKLNGWQVRTDQAMADGSVAIYADSGRRPLWITLRPNAGAPGTTYTLVGAMLGADTTKLQRSGSSMSSNRIQRR